MRNDQQLVLSEDFSCLWAMSVFVVFPVLGIGEIELKGFRAC